MKTTLKKSDTDFDKWAVKLNGEYLQHATVVSANAATGTVVRNALDGDGNTTSKEETLTGNVRLVERNAAVRAKEPAEVRVVQKGQSKKSTQNAPEPAAGEAKSEGADGGSGGKVKIPSKSK